MRITGVEITGIVGGVNASLAAAAIWRASRADRRSEDAERSAAEADRAAVRSAAALREANEMRTRELIGPAIAFEIERGGQSLFFLRNVGHSAAWRVTLEAVDGFFNENWPEGIDIEPGDGWPFEMIWTAGAVWPGSLVLTCAQVPRVRVRFPTPGSSPR